MKKTNVQDYGTCHDSSYGGTDGQRRQLHLQLTTKKLLTGISR